MGLKRHTAYQSLFASGHRACPGCGLALAVRHILDSAGDNIIVVSPTGCLETFTSPYGYSSWRVPWIHHLFENSPAVAGGVAAALKAQERTDTRVLVIGGDGATFDIGFGSLSGMLERGDDVLYICTDNAAYMNTGGQRSASTPYGAATTTSPAGKYTFGKKEMKKNLPEIIAAHGTPYVATASAAYLKDLRKKVQKAMTYRGPRYIQVETPCPSVWGFSPHLTLEIGRKAVKCGLTPLWEMENGQISNRFQVNKPIPVEGYLKEQKRFQYLFKNNQGDKELKSIQAIADLNLKKYQATPGRRSLESTAGISSEDS